MKYSIKILKSTLPILFLSLLTGCLPWPHTTPRSNAASGRVLDAVTRKPIQGAKVSFLQPPEHAVYTDKNGYFYLKATRNFHWGYVTPGGDWPDNKDNNMQISHPNYIPIGGCWGTNSGDIFLTPK
ncbi:MAG TPA: hypothetical protein VFV23_13200 [Verrucomicrobiae bacterium]|nr:hypothetical protein [Verrucomicrobiae bacterium]